MTPSKRARMARIEQAKQLRTTGLTFREIAEQMGLTVTTVSLFASEVPRPKPPKPPKPQRPSKDLALAAAMEQAPTATLAELGAMLGVTRERVRQMMPREEVHQRRAERKAIKEAVKAAYRASMPESTLARNRRLATTGLRYCSSCQEEKLLDQFYANGQFLTSRCRACSKQHQQRLRASLRIGLKSPHRAEVLRLREQGMSQPAIGAKLGITQAHVSTILRTRYQLETGPMETDEPWEDMSPADQDRKDGME